MADDVDIRARIDQLIARQHEIREHLAAGESAPDQADDRAALDVIEQTLDQCWDLLRQRQALREFGRDPGGAEVRPASEVEGYQQ
jgi:hypothetical protein